MILSAPERPGRAKVSRRMVAFRIKAGTIYTSAYGQGYSVFAEFWREPDGPKILVVKEGYLFW